MRDDFKVAIPEGQSGIWKVTQFTVSEEDAKSDAMRSLFSSSGRGRYTPAGTYTALHRGGYLVMSDTPDEIRDHLGAIRNAKGHCLVFGLGIGMVAKAMLDKPEVTKLTVVELSPDVIALTAPTLKAKYGDRFEVVNADALEWKPPKGVRYGAVWADIWDNLTSDNLPDMTRFNRRYGRLSDWHGNWGEGLCREHARRSASRRW
jgi:hypothetical protein